MRYIECEGPFETRAVLGLVAFEIVKDGFFDRIEVTRVTLP